MHTSLGECAAWCQFLYCVVCPDLLQEWAAYLQVLNRHVACLHNTVFVVMASTFLLYALGLDCCLVGQLQSASRNDDIDSGYCNVQLHHSVDVRTVYMALPSLSQG